MFFELLEKRRLLSVTFDPGTGVLTVTEPNGRSTIRVSQSGSTLTVQDQNKSKGYSNVTKLVIQDIGKSGKDAFLLSPSVTVPALIIGGTGGDTITGGSGNDTIIGFGGPDVISGGAGHDVIYAGENGDPLATGTPPNTPPRNIKTTGATISGGTGNDSIVGALGEDVINGDAGNDTVHGGAASDTISGGDDADYLFGDAGGDSVDGGLGGDTIGSGVEPDTIDGGGGGDLIGFHLPDPVTGVIANTAPVMGSRLTFAGPVMFNDNPPFPDPDPHVPSTDPGPGASVNGGEGDDTLVGGPNNDTLNGGDGADNISGGDGNDMLNGQDGDNTVNGNAGDDTVSGGHGNNQLLGEGGNDVIINNNGEEDTVDGGDGIDLVQDDNGNDFVDNAEVTDDPPPFEGETDGISFVGAAGGPFNNFTDDEPAEIGVGMLSGSRVVNVSGGPSVISNAAPSSDGAGNITIYDFDGIAHTILISQDANNTSVSDNGVVTVFPNAQAKNFTIYTDDQADYISLYLVNATSYIDAGEGNDSVVGGNLGDTVYGEGGADSLAGINGDDILVGGNGNDSVFGGPGTDYVSGGHTGFTYNGGDGTDLIKGGDGNDYADYRYRLDAVTLRLDGTARSGAAGENDTIDVSTENALGGQGNDTLIGNSLANYLSGGNGADTVFGNGGGDVLIGSNGGDRAFGGADYDFIYVSGDATTDGYNFGGTAAEFVQRDTGDNVVTNVNPSA